MSKIEQLNEVLDGYEIVSSDLGCIGCMYIPEEICDFCRSLAYAINIDAGYYIRKKPTWVKIESFDELKVGDTIRVVDGLGIERIVEYVCNDFVVLDVSNIIYNTRRLCWEVLR